MTEQHEKDQSHYGKIIGYSLAVIFLVAALFLVVVGMTDDITPQEQSSLPQKGIFLQ